MTDAKMLQNLLAVYEAMVSLNRAAIDFGSASVPGTPALKEVIAELRRRVALDDDK